MNFEFNSSELGEVTFTIVDMNSSELMKSNVAVTNGSNYIKIDASNLLNGMYTLIIDDGNNRVARLFVINK